jgi:hypothetical protein
MILLAEKYFLVWRGIKMETTAKPALRLNAFHLKVIALVTMTLDHIGSYQTFTINRTFNDALRIIGRIAAPLFLFMVVEGLRHTRSKPKYILRLYTAGVIIESVNRVISRLTGTFEFGNTLPMFFYTALFVFCIETIINTKKVFLPTCGILIPFLSYFLNIILMEQGFRTAWSVISLFLPSPMNVDYSILFVLMGVAWYFINSKAINCMILAGLSAVCFAVPASWFFTFSSVWLKPVFFNVFGLFVDTQWCMFLAIPFILLYNGEKGRSMKYFFYIYYPVHVYVLFFIRYIRNFF